MTERRLSYRFGPLERRGILGPLRAGQAIAIALGAVIGVALLDASPNAVGAFLATGTFLGAALFALAPAGRRTAGEWIPIALTFVSRYAGGGVKFLSRAPTIGARAHVGPPEQVSDRSNPEVRARQRGRIVEPAPDAPSALRGARIIDAEYRDRPIGAIAEQGGRRLTAILACRVVSFSLLDSEAQERRLSRWGLVLTGAANTPIRRLQWVERTAPAQGDELARWLHRERDPTIPPRGTPMIESYLELIGSTAQITQEHEILLAVQVDSRKVRDRGRDAVLRSLVEQTERVAQGLERAEVTVLGALSSAQVARALRTAFDPFARAELAAIETADPGRQGLSESGAWPLGAREGWDHYCSDGALHATYWIGGWPRVDVSPMFMDALLGRSNVVRTVSVTFEPISLDRSTREVEAAVTRDRADRELRHRFGQSETARQRQAQEATMRREAELAAGHSEVRLAGFVTVSGRDRDDLRRACSEVQDHAARARLELHRMYGQQADAFTFTLPLCRGMK